MDFSVYRRISSPTLNHFSELLTLSTCSNKYQKVAKSKLDQKNKNWQRNQDLMHYVYSNYLLTQSVYKIMKERENVFLKKDEVSV